MLRRADLSWFLSDCMCRSRVLASLWLTMGSLLVLPGCGGAPPAPDVPSPQRSDSVPPSAAVREPPAVPAVATLEELQAETAAHPHDPGRWLRLARALRSVNRPAEAAAAYRQAVACPDSPPQAPQELAWLLATHADPAVRDPQAALHLAEETHHRAASAAEAMPADIAARLSATRAAALAAAGQFNTAISAAEQAVRQAWEAGDKELAAQITQHLRHYETGRPFVEAPVAQAGPAPVASADAAGAVVSKSGDITAALAAARTYLPQYLSAEGYETLNQIARALAAGGRSGDVAAALLLSQRLCQATSRRQPAYLHTLSLAQTAAGDRQTGLTTARQALQQAQQAGQSALAEQIEQSLQALQHGAVPQAAEGLPEESVAAPAARVHAIAGQVLLGAQHTDAAMAALRRACEAQPGCAALELRLAEAQLIAGDAASAADLLRQCLSRAPDHAGALLLLARAYEQQGRAVEAVSCYVRLVRLQPQRVDVANDLA